LRELQRIRRDREERDAMKKEREEAEARRNMSDAEIAALKAKDGLLDKERKQMKVRRFRLESVLDFNFI